MRYYRIQHVSCDGSGFNEQVFRNAMSARTVADAMQAAADARGNPWGYFYIVRGYGPSGPSWEVYCTGPSGKAVA